MDGQTPKGCHVYRVIGIDPALRHGAMVYSEFQSCPLDQIRPRSPQWDVSMQVLFQWVKEDVVALSQKSPPSRVFRLVHHMMKAMDDSAISLKPGRVSVAIDLDMTAGLWGARRQQIAVQSFFIGVLSGALQSQGYTIHYVAPWGIRQFLGLPTRADKLQTQRALRMFCRIPKNMPKSEDDLEGDIWDSVILGYVSMVQFYDRQKGDSDE